MKKKSFQTGGACEVVSNEIFVEWKIPRRSAESFPKKRKVLVVSLSRVGFCVKTQTRPLLKTIIM